MELGVYFTYVITRNGTYLILCLIGLIAYDLVLVALIKNSYAFTHTFYIFVWHLAIVDIIYLMINLVLVVPASFANTLPFGQFWTNFIANLDTLCWHMIYLLMGELYWHCTCANHSLTGPISLNRLFAIASLVCPAVSALCITKAFIARSAVHFWSVLCWVLAIAITFCMSLVLHCPKEFPVEHLTFTYVCEDYNNTLFQLHF